MALFDVGNYNWIDAKTACDELVLNGYNDWRLPSKEELQHIYSNLYKTNFICDIYRGRYWGSSEISANGAWHFDFGDGKANYNYDKYDTKLGRAVRAF